MAKKKLKVQKTKTKTKAKRLRPCKEVSVMAWAVDSESRVLLVRQTAGLKLWTLPGGKVRPRESLQDALLREVFEETGLKAQADQWIEIMDRPDRGTIMVLYAVTILDEPPVLSKRLSKEISQVRYSMKLPKNASPSATYFWNKLRGE
ncbi:MAG: 8-oxo-dGTP diphosphatase [Verrucomicrobiota bacterium]|jgi:ADP-ribose pyrophosphatase YjhB (NUDIX family)|nr:8-oxo-dGTP diphosphatase [Verrucomicrobiota bacterium]MEA3162780.1 8-oxo-dGTP diphosphatase [Verrucomicrobiota bacterium]